MSGSIGANNNFMKYMSNPKAFTLKRWFDSLKVDVAPHDIIIERVATSLTTDKDLEDFGKLVGQVYELGYRKAVEDYREQVEKLGLKINIIPPPPPSPS